MCVYLVVVVWWFFVSGYESVGMFEIVVVVGVICGVFYYYFCNKGVLFYVVVEVVVVDVEVCIDVVVDVVVDLFGLIVVGSYVFLSVFQDNEIWQIFFVDVLFVFGWGIWCEIDVWYGFGSFKEGLNVCVE